MDDRTGSPTQGGDVQALVLRAWSAVFSDAEIGPDTTFLEVGGDSFRLIEIIEILADDIPDIDERLEAVVEALRQEGSVDAMARAVAR